MKAEQRRNPRSRRASGRLGASAAALLLPLVGCGGGGSEDPAPAGVGEADLAPVALVIDGFVEDSSCTECHGEIARAFHDVGMGRSFARWRPEVKIEDLANARVDHAASKRRYEMVEREGGLYLRRWQVAADGKPINEIELKADWAIGSGNHARSYAHQTAAGDLFELPITWYSQTGRWGMSPGYDSPNNPDLLRRVGRDCLTCHNAYPAVEKGSDVYGRPHEFPLTLPEGIGCQRCHGPGQEHVRIASRTDATEEEIRSSIVNPVRLEPLRRDDVCLQCHLQPSTAFTTLTRAFGKGESEFRPGDALHEHLVVIDFGNESERAERFEINHHSYRMHQSPCYTESDGALTCLTCHDPHRKPPVEQRAAMYRERCLTCHEEDSCTVEPSDTPSHIALDDCVACHMPQRRPQDVVHAVMTDHRIGIHPDAASYLAERGEHAPLQNVAAHLYWPDRMASDPHAPLYPLLAETVESGRPGALEAFRREVEAIQPRLPEPWSRLGDALFDADRLDEAIAAYQRALSLDSDHAMALSGLGSAQGRQGRLIEATQTFAAALNADPDISVNLLNMGIARAASGAADLAIPLLERAAELDPLFVNAHLQLAAVFMDQGEFAQAEVRFRQAMAIEPRTEAYSGWGDALRLTGDWKQATRVWVHGMTMTSQDRAIPLQLAFARLLAPDEAVRDAAAGLDLALTARDAEPDNPHATLAVAVGFLLNGQAETAIEESRRAEEQGADAAATTLVLGIAQARLGNTESAGQVFAQFDRAFPPGLDFIRDRLLELLRESVR